MNKKVRAASAASAAVCLALAACGSLDDMGRQEKALNEQAAWAAAQGIGRDRPPAMVIVASEDGKIRLTAQGLTAAQPAAQAASRPASASAPPAPQAPGAAGTGSVAVGAGTPSPAPESVAAEAQADSDRRLVLNTILAWRKAWMEGDARAYLGYYEDGFMGDLATRAAWEKQRRERLASGKIVVRIENMAVRLTSTDTAQAVFTQRYASARTQDVGTKTLKLRKLGGSWRIAEETWRRE